MQHREPNIKPNKLALEFNHCKVCGTIIADPYSSPIGEYSDHLPGIKFASQADRKLCKACAAEECPQNYRHPVKVLDNGLHYCKHCNKIVERMGGYREHVKENDIKVEANIMPATGEISWPGGGKPPKYLKEN